MSVDRELAFHRYAARVSEPSYVASWKLDSVLGFRSVADERGVWYLLIALGGATYEVVATPCAVACDPPGNCELHGSRHV